MILNYSHFIKECITLLYITLLFLLQRIWILLCNPLISTQHLQGRIFYVDI